MAPSCHLKEVQRGTKGHSQANSYFPSYFFYPLWWSHDLVFLEPGFLIICKNPRSCLIKMQISRSPHSVPEPRAAFKEPLSLFDTEADCSCSTQNLQELSHPVSLLALPSAWTSPHFPVEFISALRYVLQCAAVVSIPPSLLSIAPSSLRIVIGHFP